MISVAGGVGGGGWGFLRFANKSVTKQTGAAYRDHSEASMTGPFYRVSISGSVEVNYFFEGRDVAARKI